MSNLLLAAIVGIPLAWHVGLTGIVYWDAPRVGLEPRTKWVAIVFLIPLIGFFIYIFERSELDYDPDEDPYKGHNFNIHPSRADDAPLRSRGDDRPDPDDADWDGADDEWGDATEADWNEPDAEWGDRREETDDSDSR